MNLRGAIFSLLVSFSLSQIHGQEVVNGVATGSNDPKKSTIVKSLALQAGFSYAVINNRYETRAQYKSGINIGLVRRINPWFAIEAGFTRYKNHTATSLDDILSWAADLNAQFSMRVGESDLFFRTVFGLGYVDWKGYYVGPSLNDNYHYYYGKLLNDRFYTGNLGWGFSHLFFKQRLEGFGDFRLRIAADKKVLFSISDTAFLFGLRYNIRSSDRVSDNKSSANRSGGKQKKSRVYKWLKNR